VKQLSTLSQNIIVNAIFRDLNANNRHVRIQVITEIVPFGFCIYYLSVAHKQVACIFCLFKIVTSFSMSFIYMVRSIYLYNRCLSPPMLWVRLPPRARCTTLSDKSCQCGRSVVFSGSFGFLHQ
jgi:hypothetical protein